MRKQRKNKIDEIITGIIIISIPFFLLRGFPLMGMHLRFPLWSWIFLAFGIRFFIRGISRLSVKSKKITTSKKNLKKREIELENKVLKMAQATGGKVTVAKTALDIDAPIKEIETILNNLVSRDYASVEISPEGQILYTFPDFQDMNLTNS